MRRNAIGGERKGSSIGLGARVEEVREPFGSVQGDSEVTSEGRS